MQRRSPIDQKGNEPVAKRFAPKAELPAKHSPGGLIARHFEHDARVEAALASALDIGLDRSASNRPGGEPRSVQRVQPKGPGLFGRGSIWIARDEFEIGLSLEREDCVVGSESLVSPAEARRRTKAPFELVERIREVGYCVDEMVCF